MPKKTAADFLIESEFVFLAREDPGQPFSYSAVEILKGHSDGKEFGLFVDSTTRRLLKANPEYAVLLVRKNKDEPWHSLGVADNQYKEVIMRILALSNRWTSERGANERFKFFLPLLDSKHQTIFELAYLELGRAPYSTIKKMAKFVSQDDIRPMLHRREFFEWRSLAILLVAQNPGEQDRKLIEESFRSCHKFSLSTNLAAWATAYIELNGTDAVDEIEEKYLRDANRTEAEIRAVVIALSVHGRNGRTDLRDQIVKSYSHILQNHPKLTGLVAIDLTKWKRWEYRERIVKTVEESEFEFETLDAKAINTYLR